MTATKFSQRLIDLKGLWSEEKIAQLSRVARASNFAMRHLDELIHLIESGQCESSSNDYDALSRSALDKSQASQVLYEKQLRVFRRQQMLCILFRDMTRACSTERSTHDLSNLADALLAHALCYAYLQLSKQYGEPCHEGRPLTLCTLAMGKLGGRELNFSSDIDLIFCYRHDGQTNGDNRISNQDFFTRQVQLLLKLFTSPTPEGIVFRVDLRLRPYGSSGPIALSFAALETYYQEQGRGWERYAMVKARPLGRRAEDLSRLNDILTPFTYRRYVDFSVIESLRGMKALIQREVRLKKLQLDIKRGKGGIREIEFIAQAFQLMRGGRITALQQTNLLATLKALESTQLMSAHQVDELRHAYVYLRRLENYLQMLDDRQTHCLPKEAQAQQQIALAMNCSSFQALMTDFTKVQAVVMTRFDAMLHFANELEDCSRILQTQIEGLWSGLLEPLTAENLMLSLGFNNSVQCYQVLNEFRHGSRVKRLSQAARLRLDKFMMLLLNSMKDYEGSDELFIRVIQLLESIVARSVYVALLLENKQVLEHLLSLLAKSPWVARQLTAHPFLLEVLLEDEVDISAFSLQSLTYQLKAELAMVADTEHYLDILGQFKLKQTLKLACCELEGHVGALQAGKILANLATVILTEVLNMGYKELDKKFDGMKDVINQFAIVAYGKLGSLEMSYESDLDLVFLHSVEPGQEDLVLRLTKKILHSLNTRFSAGILYRVDTRLRPSGSAGLLVSHMDAYCQYQQNEAWTWENQALVRARLIIGDESMAQRFEGLRQSVLMKKRDKALLFEEVHQMREKMSAHRHSQDIKNRRGGLIDIEFFIQYFVLAFSCQHPSLCEHTDNSRLLGAVAREHLLSPQDADTLSLAFKAYHHITHMTMLGMNECDLSEALDYCQLVDAIIAKHKTG